MIDVVRMLNMTDPASPMGRQVALMAQMAAARERAAEVASPTAAVVVQMMQTGLWERLCSPMGGVDFVPVGPAAAASSIPIVPILRFPGATLSSSPAVRF